MILAKLLIFIFSLSLVLPAQAKKARTITCPKKWPGTIYVPFNDVMTVEFPEKPRTSLPGNNNFDFKFIDNDLAIKALSVGAKANLFVYLKNDKCVFRLVSQMSGADDVVRVSYPKEKTVEAKYVR